MPKSYYKAQGLGKVPMCAICAGPGEGPRAEHYMTHGVSVWLCEAHRSEDFQTRRAGRDFAASLGHVWSAAGVRSRRHTAALAAHLRRVRPAPPRERPGSYSWPKLRQEAEQRFAAGENPREVIAQLRARNARLPARPPSVRTMRRWFGEARWLVSPAPRPPGRCPRAIPKADAAAAAEPRADGVPTPQVPATPASGPRRSRSPSPP